MKYVVLSRGYRATVDDEDYERVNRLKWYALVQKKVLSTKVYAYSKEYT